MKTLIKNFMGRRPHFCFIMIAASCLGIGLAVTQVQANIPDASTESNNPHHLPNEFNPKLQTLDEKIEIATLEAKKVLGMTQEGVSQELETIHSIAFKGVTVSSKPVFDYTTGTSN